MASVYQSYEGRFALPPATIVLTVGGVTNAIVTEANYYYMAGYTGESSAQFCEHLQEKIRSATGSPNATCTVVYNRSTGLVTFTWNASTAITWTTAALQTMMGFAGTQSAASSHVGTLKPRYIWRPSRPMRSYPLGQMALFDEKTTSRFVRSPDGTVHAVPGHEVYEAPELSYQALPTSDVVDDNTFNTFQEFYQDIVGAGQPFRVYPDRTNSAVQFACVWGEEEPSLVGERARRTVSQYAGYWDVSIPVWKYI